MPRFGKLDSMLMDEEELQNTVKPRRHSKIPMTFSRPMKGGKHFMDLYETSTDSETETDSDTDTEEEFSTIPMMQATRSSPLSRNMSGTSSKWTHIVELEGLRPQDVTAKVNTKCRCVVIKVKESTSRGLSSTSTSMPSGKLVRVIPLPHDILVDQLKVKVLPHGKLVITAPFVKSQDYSMRGENWSRYPSWLTIPVTHKGMNDMWRPTGTSSSSRMNSLDLEDENIFQGQKSKRNPKKFNQWHRGLLQFTSKMIDESEIEKMIRPDFVKDQSSGKTCMILKFNTMGFSPKNIQVEINENDQLLVIEAKEEKTKSMEGQELMKHLKNGLPVKLFRREFILPQNIVDVTNIAFCVLKSGILIVSLPLTQTEGMDMSETDVKNVDDVKKECDSWEKVQGGKSQ
jgi:HSP20 family molecular chaperone IbpA